MLCVNVVLYPYGPYISCRTVLRVERVAASSCFRDDAFSSKFDARCHSSFRGAALRGISLLVFFRDGFMVVLRKVYG